MVPLFDLLLKNNVFVTKLCAKRHVSTNTEMKDKQAEKLISAILQDGLETVKLLLSEDLNINYRDSKGWTALHYTAQKGDIQMARLLLEKGADVNAADNFGNTVLWRATFASQGKGIL